MSGKFSPFSRLIFCELENGKRGIKNCKNYGNVKFLIIKNHLVLYFISGFFIQYNGFREIQLQYSLRNQTKNHPLLRKQSVYLKNPFGSNCFQEAEIRF